MTDKKKTEELNEQELDQVTGGATEELFGAYNVTAEISGIKKTLTEKAGIRVGKRADGVGIRVSNVISGGATKGEI